MAVQLRVGGVREHRLRVAARPDLLDRVEVAAPRAPDAGRGARGEPCGGVAPAGEGLVVPRRPGGPQRVAELVVDELAELVEEAEGDPAVPPRDPQVDRIAL